MKTLLIVLVSISLSAIPTALSAVRVRREETRPARRAETELIVLGIRG